MCMTKTLTNEEVKECIIGLLKSVDREGIDKLIDYLCKSDFFDAPASTRYHGAEEGGLARHSLNVYYRLFSLVAAEHQNHGLYTDKQIPAMNESIILVALLHDLCKTGFYKISSRNVKNEETGKWEKKPYYTIDDTLPMGHGEKSLYVISGFIKLKREEAMAIRWHMGFSDSTFKGGDSTVGNAFNKYPLAVLTHLADLQATYLDEQPPAEG